MRIHILQALNAITMVFPLASLVRHFKTSRGIMKHVLLLHIPVSFAFHAVAAIRGPSRALYALDTLGIHASCLVSNIDMMGQFRPAKHIPISLAHSYLWAKGAVAGQEYPTALFLLALGNNLDVFGAHKKHATLAALSGLGAVLAIKPAHPLFHVLLYGVYEPYFKVMSGK